MHLHAPSHLDHDQRRAVRAAWRERNPGSPAVVEQPELSASARPLLLLSVEGQERHLPRPGDGTLDVRGKGEDYRYPFAADLVENS